MHFSNTLSVSRYMYLFFYHIYLILQEFSISIITCMHVYIHTYVFVCIYTYKFVSLHVSFMHVSYVCVYAIHAFTFIYKLFLSFLLWPFSHSPISLILLFSGPLQPDIWIASLSIRLYFDNLKHFLIAHWSVEMCGLEWRVGSDWILVFPSSPCPFLQPCGELVSSAWFQHTDHRQASHLACIEWTWLMISLSAWLLH